MMKLMPCRLLSSTCTRKVVDNVRFFLGNMAACWAGSVKKIKAWCCRFFLESFERFEWNQYPRVL
jgi:hypothetical protein